MAEPRNTSVDVEQHVEREVQRRVAKQLKANNDYIADLRDNLQRCQHSLIRQNNLLTQMTTEPLCFGTLLKVQSYPDPSKFKLDDEVLVIDPKSPHHLKGGRIIKCSEDGPIINNEGCCFVKLADETQVPFSVGLEGKSPAQIRLTQKDDGTFAVVNVDGKPWEVRRVPDPNLKVGDCVKVKPDTKAIVGPGYTLSAGPICNVVALSEMGIEVMHKGDKHLVYNPRNLVLEEGDRVACDPTMFCVIEKLSAENRKRYKLSSDLNITWDEIGGLEGPKQELRDALELPYSQPNLFKFYGVEPLRGVLLWGPPGCGKTLLAKAAAYSVAKLHGKAAVETGYIYVKSPELLDKWVGNTEKEIRELFERGRRHFRQYGYKAILALDEADAILPQRGTRRSSDISDTIVPMFLGEMDGIDSKQTEENPIVFLMTNRADVLDPAVTRPGRINRHIKVDRPTEMTSIDILGIHTKNMPFQDPKNRMAILAITASDIFSKSRLLYRINNEHDFTLGECCSGALLANIAEIAKMRALHRDLKDHTQTGVVTEDLREAVQKVFVQQRGINHSYDISDFCDKVGIQAGNAKIERCFGAA